MGSGEKQRGEFCFPRLTCLELDPGDRETPQDIAASIQEFLRCVPPLKNMTLSGGHRAYDQATTKAIKAVLLDYHGKTLSRLSLPHWYNTPIIRTPGDAHEIVTRCPQLNHLSLSMTRSGGNLDEVKIYQQLGSHPLPQSICLILDWSQNLSSAHLDEPADRVTWGGKRHNPYPTMILPTGVVPRDHYDRHLRNGHIRQALVDFALDGPLAAAISQCCAGAKPFVSTPLKSLEVRVSNAGLFRFSEVSELDEWGTLIEGAPLHPIFKHLGGCTWTVMPHPSDALPGKVVTVAGGERSDTEPVVLGALEPLFRSLWPEGSSGDCRGVWHSFPLAGYSKEHQDSSYRLS